MQIKIITITIAMTNKTFKIFLEISLGHVLFNEV